jgi:predicted ATP-grasp superfamily ATP-dependent carboligase
MKDVVVLAGAPGSVLSICECAYRHGVKSYVICIDSGEARLFSKSKYVTCSYDVTASDFIPFINNFVLKHAFAEKPIMYFTSDQSCRLVSKYREKINVSFDLCLPSNEIIHNFSTKGLAETCAENNGLTVPKTKIITTTDDIEKIEQTFDFPVIIKPVIVEDKAKTGFKARILDKIQFASFTKNITSRSGRVLCQEYIPGKDENCKFYMFYRSKDGRISECIGKKNLQSPPLNGIMAIGTTEYDENLSEISKKFLAKINYFGLGGIEYKKYNGKYYFIEMSVRAEGFLSISDIAEISHAETSFCDINGFPVDMEKKQKEKVNYYAMLSWMRTRVRQRKFLRLLSEMFMVAFYHNHKIGDYMSTQLRIAIKKIKKLQPRTKL